MVVRNIYISGPDGVGKTTIANRLATYIFWRGKEAKVIPFPSGGTISFGAIKLHLNGRVTLGDGADDLLFVANRLEMILFLRELRREKPNLIFLFDRNPFDGAVYAEAKDSLREKPLGIKFTEALENDKYFLEAFPVNLGVLVTGPEKTARERINSIHREGKIGGDVYDQDAELQKRVAELFEQHLVDRENWIRLKTTSPLGRETFEESIERQVAYLVRKIFVEIKREGSIIREKE